MSSWAEGSSLTGKWHWGEGSGQGNFRAGILWELVRIISVFSILELKYHKSLVLTI